MKKTTEDKVMDWIMDLACAPTFFLARRLPKWLFLLALPIWFPPTAAWTVFVILLALPIMLLCMISSLFNDIKET